MASRFVQRLAAVAGDALWQEALARGARYRRLALRLDAPQLPPRPIPPPQPRPPVSARPRSLSVTEIEHWLRDPYTIYAKHILRLPQLDPVGMEPGAAAPRQCHPRGDWRFCQASLRCPARRSHRRAVAAWAVKVRPDRGFSRGAGVLVAAFSRIAQWFASFERTRRSHVVAAARGSSRRACDRDAGRRVSPDRTRRPHRTTCQGQLRDPGFQDRRPADR